MTATTLRSYTLKDLAQLAKRRGVDGWQSMRKDQLVRAILRAKKPTPAAKAAAVKKASIAVRHATSGKNGVASARSARQHEPVRMVARRPQAELLLAGGLFCGAKRQGESPNERKLASESNRPRCG